MDKECEEFLQELEKRNVTLAAFLDMVVKWGNLTELQRIGVFNHEVNASRLLVKFKDKRGKKHGD